MKRKNILIVEDEPDVRETLKEILELEGFNVLAAENGAVALQYFQQGTHSCLILLDLMMPVMNGWQFLEALKNNHLEILNSTPIIVVSAAADVTSVKQQYNCQVMNKPCNLDSLLALAHQYCEAC
jgi:CheY-like chemotaxis protein